MSTFLESIELVSILRIMAEVRVLGDILTVSPQMLETGPGGGVTSDESQDAMRIFATSPLDRDVVYCHGHRPSAQDRL